MTDRIGRQELLRMMESAAARIREQQGLLSQLDCIAGDGDHGTTMLRIMDRLEGAFKTDAPDLRASFSDAGWNVMGSDGGASSSLLGAFFLGVGEATRVGVSSWDCIQFAAALQAGLQAIQAQTKARSGDKTLMDALAPAVESLVAAAQAGNDLASALKTAAEVAKAGASSTENLIARYGRARLLGEKTRGHQDPGATSVALIFDGFSQAASEMKGGIEHARHG